MSYEVSIAVPTTIPSEQTADVEAALAAYRGYMGVAARSSTEPSGDWTTEIRQFAGDPFALLEIESIAALAQQKVRSVGITTYTAAVESVESNRIVLATCVDNSAALLLVDGVEVEPTKPYGDRFTQTVRLYKNEQSVTGWLVSEVETVGTPC